ncbi:hypothetical protein GCM10010106_17040 [Thermopolyspora flexuosa]|jgi:threonine dehydrogenase-like Zn-dependent dehydrogenase|uniref:Uncharacterized protein n=1 Tax=Thermopolyspora flexuosa TaxID=103836 RepID=A0A543J4F0_9ACTN|nr:hypothetical protein [Thermopolyspora flexuosa]TQM77707.1 hypothetical protein FHX40_4478 [Thermopolyspora flexuosa]GGM71344.1 hypothetical protein GCM10010106_17040 [Thermopolyspora flexuosa]
MTDIRGLAVALLTVVGAAMLTAGPVMVVRGRSGRAEIRRELADQKIVFPEAEKLPPHLARHAGAAVATGDQAKAFADMIGANVRKATGGRTYSEISAQLAERRGDEELTALRQTAFMGQTLRASLMSAYQAWHLTTLVIGLGLAFMAIGAALVMTAAVLATGS